MNTPRNSRRQGFNSLDLLVMLVAVVIVAMLILPTIAKRRAKGSHVSCAGMLMQIGLSVRLWSDDNGGRPPSLVPTREGGAKELIEAGSVAGYFQVMSNELGTPRILICWTDRQRTAATNFTSLQNSNISYFVVPEADPNIPMLWLAGDRNLATNNVPLKLGLFTMPTNRVLSWTAELHEKWGYLCLADGSVQVSDGDGRVVPNVRLQQSATNALSAYFTATTNSAFRIAIP